MKINYTQSPPAPIAKVMSDIPIGTTFFGRFLSGYGDHLFLRMYDGVVSLTNPQKTWSGVDPIIYDFRVVSVEINVAAPAPGVER